MKTEMVVNLIGLLGLLGSITLAVAQGTAFTYQGRLMEVTQPAHGLYDFLFRLYDAPSGGNAVGPLLATNALPVNNGLFMVELDFGAGAFTGEARWLQISVQTNSSARLTALSPRQAVLPTPQAQLALTVPDGVITGAKLAPGAVQALHLQAGAITAAHLAAGSVQASNIAAGAITSTQLAAGAVQSNHLAAAAIGVNHLAAGAAAANLAAGGQAGVGPGGIILSANADNAALAAAGYTSLGEATLGAERWRVHASPEDRLWTKSDAVAVWTGTDMIVIGTGITPDSQHWERVHSYDPVANTWRAIPVETHLVSEFLYPTFLSALWTGTELIVLRGVEKSTGPERKLGGAIYNPATQSWRSMSENSAPGFIAHHSAVWTGSEVLVWGGMYVGDTGFPTYQPQTYYRHPGWRYNPASDTWSTLSQADQPPHRYRHYAVWTGSEMIVWGGFMLGSYDPRGGRYRPATDTWHPMSTNNAPNPQLAGYNVVWTGTEMLVWNGLLAVGGRYRPASDTWTPMSNHAALEPRGGSTTVWTGNRMLLWGGSVFGTDILLPASAGAYDPATDTWTLLSQFGAPTPRTAHVAVWGGQEMIVWGGRSLIGYFFTGARYRPANNTWTALPNAPTLSGRDGHAAVWTGSEMIVWGGFNGATNLQTGARYNPAANTWTEMSVQNAPAPRSGHTLVWDGTHVIVWGGENGGDTLRTGGRYDPLTDTWSTLPTVDAPQCSHHQAAWVGTVMLIHGGFDGFQYSSALHAYSPARQVFLYLKP